MWARTCDHAQIESSFAKRITETTKFGKLHSIGPLLRAGMIPSEFSIRGNYDPHENHNKMLGIIRFIFIFLRYDLIFECEKNYILFIRNVICKYRDHTVDIISPAFQRNDSPFTDDLSLRATFLISFPELFHILMTRFGHNHCSRSLLLPHEHID